MGGGLLRMLEPRFHPWTCRALIVGGAGTPDIIPHSYHAIQSKNLRSLLMDKHLQRIRMYSMQNFVGGCEEIMHCM